MDKTMEICNACGQRMIAEKKIAELTEAGEDLLAENVAAEARADKAEADLRALREKS